VAGLAVVFDPFLLDVEIVVENYLAGILGGVGDIPEGDGMDTGSD
jgi:hypothetical protein